MKITLLSLFMVLILQIDDCNPSSNVEPCFTDREVSEEIVDVEVECIKIGDEFYFSQKAQSKRYTICNAKDFDLKENVRYKISGICYEVKPNERWPGTPFQLTKLKTL